MLFTIFAISSYVQWEFSQEIKHVSEYHKNMSIPAISILNEIKLNFQMMHMQSMEIIQRGVSDKKIQEIRDAYQVDRDIFDEQIEQYASLSLAKNSRGQFLAPTMMQDQMHEYIKLMQQKMESNDSIIKQYENGEISRFTALPLLLSIGDQFHNTVEDASKMEIRGMENTQSKISQIEEKMATLGIMSLVFGVVIATIIVVLTSKFVSIPINRLIAITKKIANGETVEINPNSKNSDANEIMVSLDKMSKDLGNYKSKILKQEKLSSIGELASRLAHDIRNPLTVIKVSLDIMKAKRDLSEEELKKFQRVDDAMYRITHQIDNVLDFVKGKPLKLTNQPLKKIIDSVIRDIPEAEKVKFVNVDNEIKCDFELMKVVLINLLINAIQATDENGKIKITSESRDNSIMIQVEDNGPGIPEDKLGKIFEPLFTTKQEGTGLGLASCKSIIEQHGGKISVKNNPTRFIIELPQNK
ncbi:MAG: HAMP domain-containing histidine kinase [Nitrosopumilus sp.]|nr:HAMP domain-containing histidine kinase [Nitrosopumilus sp.]